VDPIAGDDPCDVIDDYPLFTIVNTGKIGRELDRRGTIYCDSVEWDVAKSKSQESQGENPTASKRESF
jgi:hypothetical protein